MSKQITLEGGETKEEDLLDSDCGGDVYRAMQEEERKKFFSQHEKRSSDAEGYIRLPGPCGSTHLMPVEDYMAKEFHQKRKIPDVLRYFKCHRCERVVDRAKELMMQYSGGNQTLGLQRPFHSYCWDCYCIESKEGRGLGGITGREFASVASAIMNDRRMQENDIHMFNDAAKLGEREK